MTRQSQHGRTGDEDVVAFLMRQHGEIRNLFDEVERTTGQARRDALHRLVRLLAVHETAEEEVVHPVARHAFDGADHIVRKRLDEEHDAKEQLAQLERIDPEGDEFLAHLQALREAVMVHARAEERYEFPHLRRSTSYGRLHSMTRAVRAAEAVAPTHPHPGVEGRAGNLVVGPVAALVDRARDAVRKALGQS